MLNSSVASAVFRKAGRPYVASRYRRCLWMTVVVLFASLLSLYYFMLDDSLMPDVELEALVPPTWAMFKKNSVPVRLPVDHALHVYFTPTAAPSSHRIDELVRRWGQLDDVARVPVPQNTPRQRWAWNGIRGVFLEVIPRSSGGSDVVWHDAGGGWGHYRLRKGVVRYVTDAIQRYVNKSCVFHLGVDDNDLFHVATVYRGTNLVRQLWGIISDFPEMYFLHWNPTIVDTDFGILGPRMIPIPDYESFYVRLAEVQPPRSTFPDGVPLFGWRGGSTGAFKDYKQSDRSVIVRMLNDDTRLSNISDVKFDGIGEHVTSKDVPQRYIAPSQKQSEMSTRVFQLDIDGNANSWRGLRWKLGSGAPVIKVASPFVQWYYPLLREREHLLLWNIDDPGAKDWLLDLASSAKEQYSDYAAMAQRGGSIAQQLFHRKAAEAILYDSIRDLQFFEVSRDWRIRSAEKY
jgi:hypothetical protein